MIGAQIGRYLREGGELNDHNVHDIRTVLASRSRGETRQVMERLNSTNLHELAVNTNVLDRFQYDVNGIGYVAGQDHGAELTEIRKQIMKYFNKR